MKRILETTLLLLVLLLPATATAYDFVSNNIYYRITSSNTVEVTYKDNNYNSYYKRNVDIPNTVTHNGTTYTVTAIGDLAFYGSKYLNAVTIPNSVNFIGGFAFGDCDRLNTVYNQAYYPPTVSSNSFPSSATSNATLYVPYSRLSSYQNSGYWNSFSSIKQLPYDFEVDDIYYLINDSNATVTYKYWKEEYDDYDPWKYYSDYVGVIVIPESVTFNGSTYTVNAISHHAFAYSEFLSKVTIPSTVLSIGYASFLNCENLSEVICLANTPPDLSGGIYSGPVHFGHYWNIAWDDEEFDYSDYISYGVPAVLLVPDEAYNNYINDELWRNNFSYRDHTFIAGINADTTVAPIIVSGDGYDGDYVRDADEFYVYIEAGENSTLFAVSELGTYLYGIVHDGDADWSEFEYNHGIPDYGSDEGLGRHSFAVYAYAIAEGKKPSAIVSKELCYDPNWIANKHSYEYDLPYIYVFEEEEGVYCYDIPVYYHDYYRYSIPQFFYRTKTDDVYYNIKNDSTLEVTQGKTNHYTENIWVWYEGEEEMEWYESEVEQDIDTCYYRGDVIIPESAQGMGWHFVEGEGCLCDLEINGRVTSIGDNAFYNCQELTSVTIPNSISTIGCHAFDGCTTMPSITIPNSVSTIGDSAFLNCDVLTEIHCMASIPPSANDNTFLGRYDVATLYVPIQSINAYRNAACWKNFNSIVGVSVDDNYFLISDTSAMQGETIVIPISMNNEDEITAFQTDVYLPEGFEIVKEDGDYLLDLSDRKSRTHVIWATDSPDGSVHVMSYSPNMKPFSGNEGELFYITVKVPDNADGVFPIMLRNTILTTTANEEMNTSDAFCNVTVHPYLQGDVNGDGSVTISDVTALIDYLLTNDATGINLQTADVNGSGSISISDVTALIDHLLTGSWPEETFSVRGVTFKMVNVDAGSFLMGATEEQGSDAYEWESPVHQVSQSSYMIGETEVTQELWLAVMGTNPSKHTGDLQKPVDNVNWNDCQEFIGRLNELTGKSFRLPTEAEWEYAARGGNKGHGYKYAGSDNIDEVGWISSNSESTTHPVASLQPNELALYDMTGNVDEWVADYWGDYTSASQTNPTGPESGTDRVYRGGSWYGSARASRVSYRFHRSPTFLRGTMGLRLAL